MQPVEFPGSVMVGKPPNLTDEQCFAIPAMKGYDNEVGPWWIEAWKPSYEDLQALNRGDAIYIRILSQGLPPVAVFTFDEAGQINDAG